MDSNAAGFEAETQVEDYLAGLNDDQFRAYLVFLERSAAVIPDEAKASLSVGGLVQMTYREAASRGYEGYKDYADDGDDDLNDSLSPGERALKWLDGAGLMIGENGAIVPKL